MGGVEEGEEDEGLFKADAVNEEGPERDRAQPERLPRCRRLVLPRYTPEGHSPLSLHATVLSSRVVSSSVSRHRSFKLEPGWREGNGPPISGAHFSE